MKDKLKRYKASWQTKFSRDYHEHAVTITELIGLLELESDNQITINFIEKL